MYEKFYNFDELPFNMTPNSKYFFPSEKHEEALNTLIYAISQRKGFIVISGDIGAGKTTVCRTLLNKLDRKTQTALIINTRISGKDLLCTILEDFGIDYTPGSKSRLLSRLNEYLINQIQRGNNVVLIVDEAQNLSLPVLEEVRMLSNLETEHEKLIQIIFLGQPELKDKLALAQLEQLRQRIAVYYHLKPFSEEETCQYIQHRLTIAGGNGREYFTKDVLKMIYDFSGGVPRLINQICDSSLLAGYAANKQTIDAGLVKTVIEESPMTLINNDAEKKKRLETGV
jgi:general secretion pathway protein A